MDNKNHNFTSYEIESFFIISRIISLNAWNIDSHAAIYHIFYNRTQTTDNTTPLFSQPC